MDGDYRKSIAGLPALATGLSGCASTGQAPVEDRSLPNSSRPRASASAAVKTQSAAWGTYRVQRGDTIYSIAFRHGARLSRARRNGTASTRRTRFIRVGNCGLHRPVPARNEPLQPRRRPRPLRLRRRRNRDPPSPSRARQLRPLPRRCRRLPRRRLLRRQLRRRQRPAHRPRPRRTPSPQLAMSPGAGPRTAAWSARLLAGDPIRQGIDIAGQPGAPVRAAADGTVVYSGNGLIGYGELIIVKHSPAFLSAYGHNRKRLVQEGDNVKARPDDRRDGLERREPQRAALRDSQATASRPTRSTSCRAAERHIRVRRRNADPAA